VTEYKVVKAHKPSRFISKYLVPSNGTARFPRFYLPRDPTGQNMSDDLVAPYPLLAATPTRSSDHARTGTPGTLPRVSAGTGRGEHLFSIRPPRHGWGGRGYHGLEGDSSVCPSLMPFLSQMYVCICICI